MNRRPSLRRRSASGAEPTDSAAPPTPLGEGDQPSTAPPLFGPPHAGPEPAGHATADTLLPDPAAHPAPDADAPVLDPSGPEPSAVQPPAAPTVGPAFTDAPPVPEPAPAFQPDPSAFVLPDPSAPAGLDAPAQETEDAPSYRDRGRLRRRLRYLRRVRELGFRDLGGLVFDLHRFGREGTPLVGGKLEALAAVDGELRLLERALDERRDYAILREPGIAACSRCATLHGSDANFCPNCGLRFDGPKMISEVGDAPAAAPAGALPPAVPPPPLPTPPQATAIHDALPPGSRLGKLRSRLGRRDEEGPIVGSASDPAAPLATEWGTPTSEPLHAAGDPVTAAGEPATQHDAQAPEADAPSAGGAHEQPTTTQPAVAPGDEPERPAPAP